MRLIVLSTGLIRRWRRIVELMTVVVGGGWRPFIAIVGGSSLVMRMIGGPVVVDVAFGRLVAVLWGLNGQAQSNIDALIEGHALRTIAITFCFVVIRSRNVRSRGVGLNAINLLTLKLCVADCGIGYAALEANNGRFGVA